MDSKQMQNIYQQQSANACVFCQPCEELVIISTPNFQLMFDPFALVPGHLLITSNQHFGCLGEVPVNLQKECADLRNKGTQLLNDVFEKPVFRYEHGRAGHCIARGISSRSCHHYHEHLVPADISLHHEMEKRFKGITINKDEEICSLFERYDEYLLVAEANGDHRFYVANGQEVEPHLLRTLTAEAIGHPERSNWEAYSSCDLLLEGKDTIEHFLKSAVA